MSIATVAALLLLSGAPPVVVEAAPESLSEFGPQQIDADPLPPVVVPTVGPISSPLSVTPEPSSVEQPVEIPRAPNEIVVTARGDVPGDPLQEVNIASFRTVQSIDKAFVGPVAMGYQGIVPEPVRDGVGNVLLNLTEPVNFLNYLLMLKIGKAAATLARFAVNSTLGVGGLFDVAKKKPFKLPYRRNGFANTMGFYGVGPGPFFYLPVFGATTLRDMAGLGIDMMVLPNAVGAPFNRPAYAVPTTVVRALNDRIDRDAEIERLQQESFDPYVETRVLYLEMRKRDIDALKGKIAGVTADQSVDTTIGQTDPLPDPAMPNRGEPAEIDPPLQDGPPPIIIENPEPPRSSS